MQLDSFQGDLESIKELFKGDDYTLDTSALMGVSICGGCLNGWTNMTTLKERGRDIGYGYRLIAVAVPLS